MTTNGQVPPARNPSDKYAEISVSLMTDVAKIKYILELQDALFNARNDAYERLQKINSINVDLDRAKKRIDALEFQRDARSVEHADKVGQLIDDLNAARSQIDNHVSYEKNLNEMLGKSHVERDNLKATVDKLHNDIVNIKAEANRRIEMNGVAFKKREEQIVNEIRSIRDQSRSAAIGFNNSQKALIELIIERDNLKVAVDALREQARSSEIGFKSTIKQLGDVSEQVAMATNAERQRCLKIVRAYACLYKTSADFQRTIEGNEVDAKINDERRDTAIEISQAIEKE